MSNYEKVRSRHGPVHLIHYTPSKQDDELIIEDSTEMEYQAYSVEMDPLQSVKTEIELAYDSHGPEKIYPESEESLSSQPPRKHSRRSELHHKEKLVLVKEVKKRPWLWDPLNQNRSNYRAVAVAWEEISNVMGRSVDECRKSWCALRDSRRYHLKSSKANASDWEYMEALSFLPEPPTRTSKSLTFGMKDASPAAQNSQEESSPTSNYTYPSMPTTASTEDPADRLAASLDSFLQAQINKPQAQPSLKHYTMLANIDRMLCKLPDTVVDDLNIEFLSRIQEEIKNQMKF